MTFTYTPVAACLTHGAYYGPACGYLCDLESQTIRYTEGSMETLTYTEGTPGTATVAVCDSNDMEFLVTVPVSGNILIVTPDAEGDLCLWHYDHPATQRPTVLLTYGQCDPMVWDLATAGVPRVAF